MIWACNHGLYLVALNFHFVNIICCLAGLNFYRLWIAVVICSWILIQIVLSYFIKGKYRDLCSAFHRGIAYASPGIHSELFSNLLIRKEPFQSLIVCTI